MFEIGMTSRRILRPGGDVGWNGGSVPETWRTGPDFFLSHLVHAFLATGAGEYGPKKVRKFRVSFELLKTDEELALEREWHGRRGVEAEKPQNNQPKGGWNARTRL